MRLKYEGDIKEKSVVLSFKDVKRMCAISNQFGRNMNYFDDFYPVYQTKDFHTHFMDYMQHDYLQHIHKFSFKKLFLSLSYKRLERLRIKRTWQSILETIFQRVEEVCKSIEVNNVLDIPADFHIHYALINFHCWLIKNKLRTYKDSRKAQQLVQYFKNSMENYLFKKTSSISVKSHNQLFRDLDGSLFNSALFFDNHFNYNDTTIADPLYKLDALAHVTIFLCKNDRYEDRVYKMGYYILESYRYFQQLTEEQVLSFDFFFNVFAIPVDYKEQIIARNPQLSPEEMEIELKKDGSLLNRKFEYCYEDDRLLPRKVTFGDLKLTQKSVLKNKINFLMKKFENMDSFDYYSTKEELMQEREKKQTKYVWNQSALQKNQFDDRLLQREGVLRKKSEIARKVE